MARAHREVYSAEYNWGESFISYAEWSLDGELLYGIKMEKEL